MSRQRRFRHHASPGMSEHDKHVRASRLVRWLDELKGNERHPGARARAEEKRQRRQQRNLRDQARQS